MADYLFFTPIACCLRERATCDFLSTPFVSPLEVPLPYSVQYAQHLGMEEDTLYSMVCADATAARLSWTLASIRRRRLQR